MRSTVLIAAGGVLVYGAWLMLQQAQQQASAAADTTSTDSGGGLLSDAGQVLNDATQSTATFLDSITGGILNISNMSRVTAADMNNANVKAMLRVIRQGEGTADAAGYKRLFGGGTFDSFADHPRTKVTKTVGGKALTSTAAGAYQFLSSTWDETARVMGLNDFSPASQDWAAVGRIAARGALEDTKAGNFTAAIQKIAKEWASMPFSPYGQPVITLAKAEQVFVLSGGTAIA